MRGESSYPYRVGHCVGNMEGKQHGVSDDTVSSCVNTSDFWL